MANVKMFIPNEINEKYQEQECHHHSNEGAIEKTSREPEHSSHPILF
jgi:hypothetical protein